MRAVIQRDSRASVRIDSEVAGEIGKGLVVLLGIAANDTQQAADYIVETVSTLRVFADEASKINLSVEDIGGAVLVVSQFTLFGDFRRGRCPSFTDAAQPEVAVPLYEYVLNAFRSRALPVSCGVFGATMEVALVNDGPATILLDSERVFQETHIAQMCYSKANSNSETNMTKHVTLRQAGGSVSATLLKDMAGRLHLEAGDRILAVETDRGILLMPYDAESERAMKVARKLAKKHRNALRELAK